MENLDDFEIKNTIDGMTILSRKRRSKQLISKTILTLGMIYLILQVVRWGI